LKARPTGAVPAPPDRDHHRVEGGRGRLSRADRADGYRHPPTGSWGLIYSRR